MTKTLMLLLASLGASVAAASAQPPSGERPEPPATRDEAVERAVERLRRADTNGDGFLTAEELTDKAGRRRARMVEMMFARQDLNDDGYISEDEIAEHAGERFDKMDTDGDGVLSEAEREAARDLMRSMRGQRG